MPPKTPKDTFLTKNAQITLFFCPGHCSQHATSCTKLNIFNFVQLVDRCDFLSTRHATFCKNVQLFAALQQVDVDLFQCNKLHVWTRSDADLESWTLRLSTAKIQPDIQDFVAVVQLQPSP